MSAEKAEEAGVELNHVDDSSIAENKKEKKDEKPKVKPSQLLNLFRYASPCDIILMLLGTLAAIAHGCALPIFTLYFGDLADGFILQAVSSNISNVVSNQIADGTARLYFVDNSTEIGSGMDVLIDCDSAFQFLVDGAYTLPSTITTIIQSVNNSRLEDAECLLGDAFIDNINIFTYAFVGIAVGVWIVSMIQISTFQFTSERQTHRIRKRYYQAILRQDIAWFDKNPTGALVNRLSDDIDKIYMGIGDKLAILIQWLTSFVAGFACAFSQDYRLTFLLLAFAPIMAVSGGILAKVTAAFTSKEQTEYAGAGAVAEEALSSIRTVYAFGGESNEAKKYDDKLKQALHLGAKKGALVGLALGFVFFFLFAIYSVGFGFGGYLVAEEGATGGTVLTVFFCVVIAAFSLGQSTPNVEALFTAAGAASVVYETIDRTPPIDSSSNEGAKPEKFVPTIELRNVDFTYPSRPDVQVMHNVSLKVDVGQTVALVGSSGCGKSTVVQLIQRFYDVDSGEVLVGGLNVKDFNVKWLRGNIGIVSQEPVLFNTSIIENIRYGKENATLEEVTEAAKKANAHNFISELPNGYDTHVGEGGAQLSGGQKQRVAIARALISNPRILLLDEATSALDAESEAVVQEALDKAREGRTTIIIAHRLSTIQNANYICAINEGRVMEVGTHAQLMEKKQVYYDLVQAQSFGTDELFIESKSLGRLFSHSSSKNDTERQVSHQVSRQRSYQRQPSGEKKEKDEVKELSLKKKQEEWDKELPDISLLRVISLNAKEWWLIILGVLGSMVNGSIFPVFALIFGEILAVFSRPTGAEILDGIGLWAGLYLLLGFVSGIAIFLKTFTFTIAGQNLTYRIRSRLFRGFLRQEIGWHDDERNSTGALTTRLAHDAAQIQGATGTRIGTILESFTSLLLTLVIAFVHSWLVTLVILGVVPLIIIAGAFQVQIFTKHATKIKKDLENAGKLAVDSIENIRTVASLTIEDDFCSKYTEEITRPYKSSIRIHPLSYGFTYSFSQAIIFFMYAVVFRFGGFVVTRDPNSYLYVEFQDVFIVFMAIIFGAISIGQASAFAPNYAKAKLSVNRVFALLDRQPLIDNYSEEGQKLENVSGAVSLDTVNFSYPTRPDVQVLQGLSVTLEPGKTLALVGPSGCGKSTVVSLIERLYDPSSGVVKMEGEDVRDLNISWLRSQIGIVSQEPVLFDGSISDNIRYGALFRDVTDEEVAAAAKAANIHNFIVTLPQGYDTNVGAKGTQLSGGQKQRIAIARALIRDPKVLLLDEATSALDTESEKVVQEALDKAREGRTTIIIAHRLSTVYSADTIAVIKGGEVLECGSHSELLASKGLYYKLNKFQMVKESVEED